MALLKVGKSDAGMQAAKSHTGALSGSAQMYEAAFRRAGVIGVDQVRIAQVQGRISRYQFRAVVVGRLTPGLRVLTVMVAGLIDLEARRFLPALRAATGGAIPLTPMILALGGRESLHDFRREILTPGIQLIFGDARE